MITQQISIVDCASVLLYVLLLVCLLYFLLLGKRKNGDLRFLRQILYS